MTIALRNVLYDPRRHSVPLYRTSVQFDFGPSKSRLNQNDRALRAILARVRACSAVRADTVSRAVPANRRRLRPSAPEPNPAKGSGETNPTFRFVSACATPCVSDSQDRLGRRLRFHERTGSVQTPHDPHE